MGERSALCLLPLPALALALTSCGPSRSPLSPRRAPAGPRRAPAGPPQAPAETLGMDTCGVSGSDAARLAASGCAVGREKPGGNGGNGVVGDDPHEGMEFRSYDEAATFYYGYAGRSGFHVSKKSNCRSKLDNCFVEVKFVCSRYEKKHEKPHALYWCRTELKAFCPCCSFEFKGGEDVQRTKMCKL